MSYISVPTLCGGKFDLDAGAIRRPASGSAVFLPAMRRFNWLVGSCMSGQIIGQTWPVSTEQDMTARRIYHWPSYNCEHVLVAALVERAAQDDGTITVTADDGGGDSATYSMDDTTSDEWYDDDSHWQLWVDIVDLADQDFQYHEVEWSDLFVRGLAMWELPRTRLELAAGTTSLGNRLGTWAGLEHRRRITDSTYAGIAGLVAGAQGASDRQRRHFNWIINEEDCWSSLDTTPSWSDLGSSELGLGASTGFGFPHTGRMLHADDAYREYYVRLYCKEHSEPEAGVGSASAQVDSSLNTVSFTGLTSSWQTLSPTSDTKLQIDCTAADSIKIQGYGSDSDYALHAAGLSLVEYA